MWVDLMKDRKISRNHLSAKTGGLPRVRRQGYEVLVAGGKPSGAEQYRCFEL